MRKQLFTKSIGMLGLMVVVLFSTFLPVSGTEVSAQISTWHSLSQGQRNFQILVQARTDAALHSVDGRFECKPYASDLVKRVSNNVAALPNSNTDSSWSDSKDVAKVLTNTPAWWIALQGGQIIQMRYQYTSGSYGPHTIIVDYADSGGLMVVDSNFSTHHPDNIVRRHYMKSPDLIKNVSAETVYQVK